jgi:hypothetical protein
MLLAGCVLLPQRATPIEQLAGEWVFVDPDGVTSTLIIDQSGRFTVDRAPEEAFRVPEGGAGFYDWDHTVDWDLAEPASGDAVIDQTGQVRFRTSSPEWGSMGAYQDPLRESLQFVIGNPDNQDSIRYVRVDER